MKLNVNFCIAAKPCPYPILDAEDVQLPAMKATRLEATQPSKVQLYGSVQVIEAKPRQKLEVCIG